MSFDTASISRSSSFVKMQKKSKVNLIKLVSYTDTQHGIAQFLQQEIVLDSL